MTRLRSCAATARQARLGSSIFALRATADRSRFAEARSARSDVRRGMRLVFLALAFMVIGGNSSLFACPMCFGAEETSMINGTKLGIAVMLGITFTVQGAFVGFFLYLRKRAKRIAEIELDTEWSELQRASRTS
jgi:hypothetical protein